MIFKRRNDWTTRKHLVDEPALVYDIVEDTASYGTGELEAMRYRIDRLTEVLGYVVSLLPPDQVRQVAIHFGYEEDRT